MLKKIKTFSYSQLSTFKICPQQYKIIYLDGIKKENESIEAFMGKRVHTSLEWLYNLDDRNIIFDKLSDKYDEEWRKHWHNNIHIANAYNNENYYYSEGKRCLSNYYNKFYPFNQKVESTELKLEFKIREYKFVGVIDRLDRNGDGNWVVHDYKTTRYIKNEQQALNDLQLGLYQIAIDQNYDKVNQISLTWHFLRSGTEVSIVHSHENINKIYNRIAKSIKEISNCLEDVNKFIPKESKLCNWCYFWEECTAKDESNHARRAV